MIYEACLNRPFFSVSFEEFERFSFEFYESFFQTQIVLLISNINESYIIVAIRGSESPCTTAVSFEEFERFSFEFYESFFDNRFIFAMSSFYIHHFCDWHTAGNINFSISALLSFLPRYLLLCRLEVVNRSDNINRIHRLVDNVRTICVWRKFETSELMDANCRVSFLNS